MRADVFLYDKGYAKSRSAASQLIKNGSVYVNGKMISKPSEPIGEEDIIEIRGDLPKYVSRGGYKLEGALEAFNIDVTGFVCADIGASTGGFTDCLLQRGAAKVYAIEGGRDQLDRSLRSDGRVINIEGCNARDLSYERIGELCDIVVMDVSFISQTLIIPNVVKILKTGGRFVSLIKPQFEAGRAGVGKNGIAKPEYHKPVCDRIIRFCRDHSLINKGLIVSPIKGGDGNTEFLAYFIKDQGA